MNAATLINQTSGEVEYYTDPQILDAVNRLFNGVISLDPASSNVANVRVGALRYFGLEMDGMQQDWKAETLWMNHPFGNTEPACPENQRDCPVWQRERARRLEEYLVQDEFAIASVENKIKHKCHHYPLYGNRKWIQKLEAEYLCNLIGQACSITFAATSEGWFQPLLRRPQCYLSPRTNYYLPDGTVKKGVTKGSVVTYYGPNIDRFAAEFSRLGVVKIQYNRSNL